MRLNGIFGKGESILHQCFPEVAEVVSHHSRRAGSTQLEEGALWVSFLPKIVSFSFDRRPLTTLFFFNWMRTSSFAHPIFLPSPFGILHGLALGAG